MTVEQVLRAIERECREEEALEGEYTPRWRGKNKGGIIKGAVAEVRGAADKCREIRALCRELRRKHRTARYKPFSGKTQEEDWESANCWMCRKYDPELLNCECDIDAALSYMGDGTVSADIAQRMGLLGNRGKRVWQCPELEIRTPGNGATPGAGREGRWMMGKAPSYIRPKTRGELCRLLKAGHICEVAEHLSEMTALLLGGWLDCYNFNVKPSPNKGWLLFVPTEPQPPATGRRVSDGTS